MLRKMRQKNIHVSIEMSRKGPLTATRTVVFRNTRSTLRSLAQSQAEMRQNTNHAMVMLNVCRSQSLKQDVLSLQRKIKSIKSHPNNHNKRRQSSPLTHKQNKTRTQHLLVKVKVFPKWTGPLYQSSSPPRHLRHPQRHRASRA